MLRQTLSLRYHQMRCRGLVLGPESIYYNSKGMRQFSQSSFVCTAFTGFFGLRKLVPRSHNPSEFETVPQFNKNTEINTIDINVPKEFIIEPEDGTITTKAFKLRQEHKYSEMLTLLQSQYDLNRILAPHVLLRLLELPATDMNKIEPPVFAETHDSTFSKLIDSYFGICQKYERVLISSPIFQDLFIRLCYHKGEVEKLTQLVDLYLKNDVEDMKNTTIAYIVGGFAMNYDVSSARSLFVTFTNIKKDLDIKLLEHTLLVFMEAGALFENLIHVLQTWILSRNVLPTARAMSIILSQAHKYGTLEELKEIDLLIYRYDLNNNYLVRQVRLKEQISNRDINKTSFKKQIMSEDIMELNEIASTLAEQNQIEELKEFYYTMMSFFVRYSTLKYVELILYKAKEDGITLDQRFYELLLRYYLIHEKFLGLVQFLESVKQKIEFKPAYLQIICDTFIRTYPYYGGEFYERFMEFIGSSSKLTEQEKQNLAGTIKIKKLDSQLRPFGFGEKVISPRKYKSKDWEVMTRTMDKYSRRKQVNFRVEKGFGDLLARGIKPDIRIIEETFRRGSLYHKTKILELSQTIRIPDKHQNRLSMINLQFATKKELQKFFKYNLEGLNCNDKIAFSRILRNKNLCEESLSVLSQINPEELVDHSRMTLFVFKLRTLIKLERFEDIIQELEAFPINEIYLSPYLIKQSIQLEQKVSNLQTSEAEECLMKFRAFIGDLKIMIHKDKLELNQKIEEMFGIIEGM